MFYPKREGIDAGTGEGQATVYPAGWDPMIETLNRLASSEELLRRAVAALTNVAAERDAILVIPGGKSDGTVKAIMGPRFRCKFLILTPYATNAAPVLQLGTLTFTFGTGPSSALSFPFQRVFDVGVDVFCYDAAAPTDTADFNFIAIGTTE